MRLSAEEKRTEGDDPLDASFFKTERMLDRNARRRTRYGSHPGDAGGRSRQLICSSLDANQDSQQPESVASEQLESDCRKASGKERRSCTTHRSITARSA